MNIPAIIAGVMAGLFILGCICGAAAPNVTPVGQAIGFLALAILLLIGALGPFVAGVIFTQAFR